MKIQNGFCFGIASLMLSASIASAQAPDAKIVSDSGERDEAILFKVHDITSVKTPNDSDIVACEFFVTFYNRSPKEINGAQLELKWVDNSLIPVVNAEKAESAERHAKGDDIDADFSFTQNGNPLELYAPINMPAIKPYKQITLKQSMKTDRCYVLLNNLTIDVKSCSVKQKGDAAIPSNENCNGMFRFISQENPEYYTDFQKISYATQKEADVKKRANQEKEMEEKYQQAVKNMDLLSQALAEIK